MLMFSHLKLNIRNLSFICKLLKPALRCSAWLSSRWAASSPGFISLHLQPSHSPHALTQDIWHAVLFLHGANLRAWTHGYTIHTCNMHTHGCAHRHHSHTTFAHKHVCTYHSHTHAWVCTHTPPTHTSWHWVPWEAFLWIGHCLS